MLHPHPAIHHLLRLLQLFIPVGAAALFFRFLFPPLLPLTAAFVLSALICRPVDALWKRFPLPRGLWAVLVILGALGILFLTGWMIWRLTVSQLGSILEQLPTMVEGLQRALDVLQIKLERILPADLRLTGLFSPAQWLAELQLPAPDLHALTGSLGWAASSLPDILLTAVFVLAAAFFLTVQRKEILGFLRRQLPEKLVVVLQRLRRDAGGMLLGWCKAQGILALVTFGLLLAGLFLLRVQSAVLLSFLITLLDLLPIIGAGLFLLPWALLELLLGNTGRSIGLALLYAAIVAIRNLLEPHVLGKQIGLHPFVSLVSVYYGWRLAGFVGMLLVPCGVLILVKLQEWGYSKLWR